MLRAVVSGIGTLQKLAHKGIDVLKGIGHIPATSMHRQLFLSKTEYAPESGTFIGRQDSLTIKPALEQVLTVLHDHPSNILRIN